MTPRRADALRNQERIVVAARELFSQAGLDVPVEEIAVRAGVGKATVYRSFPTKEHLVAAVAIDRQRWIAGLAARACEQDDAWQAFRDVILALADANAADRSLADTVAAAVRLEVAQEQRAEMRTELSRLMKKAQSQGSMLPDANVDDVRIFFLGTAHALDPAERTDATVWRRSAELFLRSIAC